VDVREKCLPLAAPALYSPRPEHPDVAGVEDKRSVSEMATDKASERVVARQSLKYATAGTPAALV